MLQVVAKGLKKQIDGKLVDELLDAYQEAKQNFYVGGLRLSAVEGGRFCEAAFRILEQVTTGKYTGLNHKLDIERLIGRLANLAKGSFADSIRLHIPRALRVVYDVRNNRDAAHLADGIDPNLQDATLVISILDWVMAEFVRLYHGVAANDAQKIIESLVTRTVPAIEDFDGFLKVLNPQLQASEYVILILYERGKGGATYDEIEQWVRPKMRANLRRTLGRLVDDLAFVHGKGDRYFLTRRGAVEVEKKRLHHVEN
jgi:hypothetical protein